MLIGTPLLCNNAKAYFCDTQLEVEEGTLVCPLKRDMRNNVWMRSSFLPILLSLRFLGPTELRKERLGIG